MMSESYNEILAVLFASGEPLELLRLADGLKTDEETARKLVKALSLELASAKQPFAILELENSYQMVTKPQYAQVIKAAMSTKRNTPLTPAALEVLAIIAYNQPVTRSFVEQIRGVDSSSAVSSLVAKGLVEESGRLELPGRPIAYKTTANFLRCFGLSGIDELPLVNDDDETPEEQLTFDEL